MTPDLCIYHGACDDGFAAAWVLWKRDGACIDYHPGVYGEAPPDVTGLDVAIVDFSYKRPVMRELAAKAKRILVLDHHKTAETELAGLADECPNCDVHFDMNRSGAVMAWNYWFPDQPVPDFLAYIQDRDLWTKRLRGVDLFTAALRSHPQEFRVWDKLSADVDALITDGIAIQRYYRTLVDQTKGHAYMRKIGGYLVPVVNASLFMSSEVAGELAADHPFAAVYAETETDVIWSLRSRAPDGVDVAEIAKSFGGGGHKHAAGFRGAKPATP